VGDSRASAGLGANRTFASRISAARGPDATSSSSSSSSVAIFLPFPTAGQARPCAFVAASCCPALFRLRHRGRRGTTRPKRAVRALPAGSALLQRAVLFEMGEDVSDGGGFFDAGHDPVSVATVGAPAHIDTKHARVALCSGDRAIALHRSEVVCAHLSRFRVGGSTFSTPRWRQLRAQLRVRRKDPVKPG